MLGISLTDSLGFLRSIDRPGSHLPGQGVARSDAEEVSAGC
jgi:hypothetical protein